MAEHNTTHRSKNFQDITGQRFGNLVVVRFAGITGVGKRKAAVWECRCDCGESSVVVGQRLKSRRTTSCGCVGRSRLKLRNTPGQQIDPSGKIILKGGHVCLVDPDRIEELAKYSWHAHKTRTGNTYARSTRSPKRRPVMMHVFLMGSTGVDHINGNGLDNRMCNLRFATSSQNATNTRRIKTSQRFRGVVPPPAPRGKTWGYRLTINGRQRTFHGFSSDEEAARAYDEAAKKHYGEFAVLNFPEAS